MCCITTTDAPKNEDLISSENALNHRKKAFLLYQIY